MRCRMASCTEKTLLRCRPTVAATVSYEIVATERSVAESRRREKAEEGSLVRELESPSRTRREVQRWQNLKDLDFEEVKNDACLRSIECYQSLLRSEQVSFARAEGLSTKLLLDA